MENVKLINEISFLENYMTDNRISKINKVLENRTQHITLVLEDIYHSHNVSAIMRTCDCFGIQDLHVIENVKRNRINKCVAQGSGKWISVKKYNKRSENTFECLDFLKKQGYSLVATALTEKQALKLDEVPVENEKIALCFGCEELGLSEKAMSMADYTLMLPMYGFTQSFNISVTTALCLQILTQKMRNSTMNWQLNEDEKIKLKHEWVKSSIKNADMILTRIT